VTEVTKSRQIHRQSRSSSVAAAGSWILCEAFAPVHAAVVSLIARHQPSRAAYDTSPWSNRPTHIIASRDDGEVFIYSLSSRSMSLLFSFASTNKSSSSWSIVHPKNKDNRMARLDICAVHHQLRTRNREPSRQIHVQYSFTTGKQNPMSSSFIGFQNLISSATQEMGLLCQCLPQKGRA
jgi:hypothetical protein